MNECLFLILVAKSGIIDSEDIRVHVYVTFEKLTMLSQSGCTILHSSQHLKNVCL